MATKVDDVFVITPRKTQPDYTIDEKIGKRLNQSSERLESNFSRKNIPNFMQKLKGRRAPKIFLDSSVIVAAVLSPMSGSFRLFQEARLGKIKLYVSFWVFNEVIVALRKKYPTKTFIFLFFTQLNPDKSCKRPLTEIGNCFNRNYSSDRKYFLTQTLKRAHLPIKILTPKEFIQKYLRGE